MANSIQKLTQDFNSLSDNNRRVVICRLKRKKARIETELLHINSILESYKKLKAERLEERKETLRNYWRQGLLEDTLIQKDF